MANKKKQKTNASEPNLLTGSDYMINPLGWLLFFKIYQVCTMLTVLLVGVGLVVSLQRHVNPNGLVQHAHQDEARHFLMKRPTLVIVNVITITLKSKLSIQQQQKKTFSWGHISTSVLYKLAHNSLLSHN